MNADAYDDHYDCVYCPLGFVLVSGTGEPTVSAGYNRF